MRLAQYVERKKELIQSFQIHIHSHKRATLSDEKKRKKKRGNALKVERRRRRGREIQKEHQKRQNGSVTSIGYVSTGSSALWTDLFWL